VPEIVSRIRADREIDAFFDAVVVSYEVQLAKPEPEIYRVMLDRIGASPADALFVDDRADNIQTARELGLHAVQFTGDVDAVGSLLFL
jgi:putative hydrolase of the HAD superfamily